MQAAPTRHAEFDCIHPDDLALTRVADTPEEAAGKAFNKSIPRFPNEPRHVRYGRGALQRATPWIQRAHGRSGIGDAARVQRGHDRPLERVPLHSS